MDKLTKVVTLSDGRHVTISELTGFDEMIAGKISSQSAKNFLEDNTQYRAVLTALSITEIEGQKVSRPTKIEEVQILMGQFKMRDTSRIAAAFRELNADSGPGDDVGENQAAGGESKD